MAKLTTAKGMHPLVLSAISSLTTALTAWIAFYFIGGTPWEKSSANISMPLLTGIFGSAGAISFFLALQPSSMVVRHLWFPFQRCIPSL